MYKIIIWGAGNRTRTCIARGYFESNQIMAIVDSNRESNSLSGIALILPEQIKKYKNFDYIVVCNQYYMEIVTFLLELGVPLEKIVITDNVKEQPYKSLFEKAQEVVPQIFEMNKDVFKHTTKTNERDAFDDKSIYADSEFNNVEYEFDYPRYRTLEFVIEEIEMHNIEGALAEVGVFRGLFSAVLNYKLPNKKIYLFDTFEGFDEVEAKKEVELGNCSYTFIESHKDTSVELMLSNLPHPEKAVICKGLFPKSITVEAEKERYAFVSLDVDFEDSTFEGLKFFYPRLSEGGYIFIHDYNTQYLKGIKKAVARYEDYIGERLKSVPIADRAGTLIIIK